MPDAGGRAHRAGVYTRARVGIGRAARRSDVGSVLPRENVNNEIASV